jgi:hypothetical protein
MKLFKYTVAGGMIKTLLEYAINISKKEITMNMDLQKRLLNPNDLEAYQMISDDFYNNSK